MAIAGRWRRVRFYGQFTRAYAAHICASNSREAYEQSLATWKPAKCFDRHLAMVGPSLRLVIRVPNSKWRPSQCRERISEFPVMKSFSIDEHKNCVAHRFMLCLRKCSERKDIKRYEHRCQRRQFPLPMHFCISSTLLIFVLFSFYISLTGLRATRPRHRNVRISYRVEQTIHD